jgi:hypothetical protein
MKIRVLSNITGQTDKKPITEMNPGPDPSQVTVNIHWSVTFRFSTSILGEFYTFIARNWTKRP